MRGLRSEKARDERGATLVLVAVSMVLLLWGGAFGVDLGLTVVGGRQTQAIADTAALDLARYVNVADWTTRSTALAHHQLPERQDDLHNTDNNSSATLTETPGVWQNGSFTPQGQKIGANTGQLPVPHSARSQRLQRREGHGHAVGAADLRRRPLAR